MNDTDLAFASIEDIGHLFRRRKLSPVELTKLMLSRIDQLNPKLNAYITVTHELALSQAKKAEGELFAPRGRKGHRDRGPLHGIPVSLKDNIYTKGIRTTAGSKILKDFVPQQDAAVWAKLQDAGAILLGKTNLHEFAYGVTTNNPHYGPTRNPWDLTRIPGGSSGGSAAAVAAGLCYASIGTDTGGSIRIPAALCGIVGLKPHYGRVSTCGVVPLSTSLDHIGPLARSVADAALVFAELSSGYIDRSAQRAPNPFTSRQISRVREKPRKLVHLGLPTTYFWDRIDDEVRSTLMRALTEGKERFALHEYHGHSIQKWTEPSTQIALAEATSFHQQSGWFPSRSAEYGEDVRVRLEMGTDVRATDYISALALRNDLALWVSLFDHRSFPGMLDAVVVPTTPFPATAIGAEDVAIKQEKEKVRAGLLRLNRPANFAGLPALSIPAGFTSSGLPVGLQIIGQVWREQGLLQIAHAFEKAHDFHLRRPPIAVAS